RRLFPWRGLALFAAIALPWCIAVSLREPDFPRYVFVRETFERVTTRAFHRAAPLWYYLPIFPIAAFPWIAPALARVRHAGAAWRARRDPEAAEPLLFACWVLVPLLFFTLNQSKLPQYVLPLVPAVALAATRNLVARGYAAVAAVLGAALLALPRWLPVPLALTPAEKAAIPPAAAALGAVTLASAALVAVGAWRGLGRTTL